MSSRPSSVSANHAVLTLGITQGWIVDESPKRKSTHQCTATVLAMTHSIAGLDLKKTVIRIRARTDDFPTGLPPFQNGQVINIEVKNVPAQKAKGKKNSAYYSLLPDFGVLGRPQPAILISSNQKREEKSPGKSAAVVVSLVGVFTKTSIPTDNGICRRFLVDHEWIAGGCTGEEVTIYANSLCHREMIEKIPDGCPVELSAVRVVNKGSYSYVTTTQDFTTDYSVDEG